MANFSVADCICLLNEHVAVLQFLLDHHNKVDALFEVALNGEFLQNPKPVIYDFLWALSDIVKQAKKLNEEMLNAVIRIISILDPSPKKPNKPSDDSEIAH